LQKEIDVENPETGISILGVNEAGYGNNEAICEGRDIPWLQDTQEDDWWGTWGITYRDVVILNRDGNEEAVFNLTEHDLGNPNEYAAFKALLFDVAGQESITTTTTTIPLSSTTSTGVFPTTTTSAPSCLSELIYGEHSEETEILRYLRDNILSQTPEGQDIIILYYQWSPVIVRAMEEDEGFKEDVKEMMDEVLLLIGGEKE
jgi:hypothetical protein